MLPTAAMGPPHFRAVCDLDGALVGRRLLDMDGHAVGVVGGGGRRRGRANEGPSIKDVRQMVGFFGTPSPFLTTFHTTHSYLAWLKGFSPVA